MAASISCTRAKCVTHCKNKIPCRAQHKVHCIIPYDKLEWVDDVIIKLATGHTLIYVLGAHFFHSRMYNANSFICDKNILWWLLSIKMPTTLPFDPGAIGANNTLVHHTHNTWCRWKQIILLLCTVRAYILCGLLNIAPSPSHSASVHPR